MGKIEKKRVLKRISDMDSVENVEQTGNGFVIHYKQEKKIPNFKKIWDETTIDQKVKFLKQAKLDHLFKINSVTGDLPNWKDFETNYQQLLRDAIRRIIE